MGFRGFDEVSIDLRCRISFPTALDNSCSTPSSACGVFRCFLLLSFFHFLFNSFSVFQSYSVPTMPHSTPNNPDVLEKLKNPDRIPHMRMIFDQTYCTSSARAHCYPGNGTAEDPYIVSWLESDPRDPYNWSLGRRAFITCCISASSLAAALSSSAYTGSTDQIMQEFGVGTEVSFPLPLSK